jgi:hypothetical protein
MVVLTDQQIAHITNVLRPLAPCERTPFQAALFEALINYRDEIGDGSLGRLLRELQRKHFRPPTDEETGMLGTRWHKLSAAPAKPPIPAREAQPADRHDRDAETAHRIRPSISLAWQTRFRSFSP